MAEVIGGSFISAFLQTWFQKIASQEVLDFFEDRRLNPRLLNKLDTTMISCHRVVDDAEEKQITQPSVKKWLDELKHAVFEADDLLDEIAYNNTRTMLEEGSSNRKVKDFNSTYNPFTKGIGAKLKEILKRLQYLVKQKDVLGLREKTGELRQLSKKISTTSVVNESSFYGRDDDKETIVKLLLSDDANGNDLGVISLVGMGGIGKTALAQVVYNDSRVQDWFSIKAWVCVSLEFDVFKITKDILKEVTSEASCEAKTHNQIQLELKQKLQGEKFLLVLDNVWNENYADWDLLRSPLKFGKQGSKIIVTTRNESVASIMGTIPIHRLKELSENDCWLLFAEHAFDNRNSNVHPEIEAIGRAIVTKCKGLPLAAKTLGGLLHSKRDPEEWEKILKTNVWDLASDSILPALKVSYHHLPSHLKPCFAYCAIFPKDYEFEKEEVILLWMAEGFLAFSKGNKEMKEVGDGCFSDLVSRSFFQQSNIHRSHFTMHDLINDLAKLMAGEVCARLEDDNTCMISQRTRHLSYARTEYDDSSRFACIYKAQFLRTFLPLSSVQYSTNGIIDDEIIDDLVSTCSHLRVLSLSQYDNVKLPNSIGSLKHLRYLNLQRTSIKRLPRKVSKLYNLQTLILQGCKDLTELPTKMGRRLINLCHLDIKETKLLGMPPEMGNLIKLQKLTDFIVGKESNCSIKELENLQHLGGEICIWNLQNIADTRDALKANLKSKKYLKELTLRWDTDRDYDTLCSELQSRILEHLQPHVKIECISIIGYGGRSFPDWLGDSSFTNIVSLSLNGCKHCSSLPPLGQLASLKDLYISAFDKIVTIGTEFYGCCTSMEKPFPSLEILRFVRMPQWQEWISYGGEAFPLLQELHIRQCPNLVAAQHDLPSLTTVEIEECQELVASFPKAPNICILKLKDCSRSLQLKQLPSGLYHLKVWLLHLDSHQLQDRIEQMGYLLPSFQEIELKNCEPMESISLDLFPCLKGLRISRCPNLKSLEISSQDFTSLTVLEIKKCPNLESFPSNFWASNLRRLQLQDCPNLKWLPEHMEFLLPSLVDLEIGNSPEIDVHWWKLSLPSSLNSLGIWDCSKLIFHVMQGNLLLPSSASVFHVGIYGSTERFPDEKLRLPSSLTSIKIWSFENLKTLDLRQLQHLSSLKELTIIHCPLLQFTAGEQLPSTLVSLRICDLQSLTSLHDLGLPHLNSLRELTIIDCPKIESMPEEGLPSSLCTLSIWKCPLLEQRCQRGGDDWSKISHIPRINIYFHKVS